VGPQDLRRKRCPGSYAGWVTPERTALSLGSGRRWLESGLLRRIYSVTPVRVRRCHPGDEDVHLGRPCPPKSPPRGLEVDLRIRGLANCCNMKPLDVLASTSCAFAMAAFMPCGPGVRMISAPKARSRTRRSRLIVSGDGQNEPVAFHGRYEGQSDAGIAAGRLVSTVLPGWIFPARSASSIMLTPMRSFTLATRIELSSWRQSSPCDRQSPCSIDQKECGR